MKWKSTFEKAGRQAIGALTFAAIMPESLIDVLANTQLISFSSSVLVYEYDHGEHGHFAGVDTVRPHLRSSALILILINSSSQFQYHLLPSYASNPGFCLMPLARAIVEY